MDGDESAPTSISIGGPNYGNVAGRDVNISPRPGWRGESEFDNRAADDGGYLTRALITLLDAYAANALQVRVLGAFITDCTLRPIPEASVAGMTIVRTVGLAYAIDPPESAICQVQAPLARQYHVDVRTNRPDTLSFGVALDT